MDFLTTDYWGGFSGVPLRIRLEDADKDKLKHNGIFIIRASFVKMTNGTIGKKTVEIKKHYLYRENESVVNVDFGAVFKTAFFSYTEASGYQIRATSIPIEVELQATYKDGNEIKEFEITEGVKVIKNEFRIFPSTFSSILVADKWYNNTRVCKDFNRASGVYTTYFRGYPQDDVVLEVTNKGAVDYKGIPRYEYKKVDRVIDQCGVFVVWRNAAGTFSYWLFSNEYTEEVKTKQLGQTIKGTRIGIGDRFSLLHSLGSTAVKRWTLKSEVAVMENELDELQSLLYSSEVYVYRGEKTVGDNNDLNAELFERVIVVEGTQKFDINKQLLYPFGVTIEFEPERTIREL
nr:MAG TPA: hypothetical protein [Caudoviricetes sp.]